MSLDDLLGRTCTLTVRKLAPPGAFLALEGELGAFAPTGLGSRAPGRASTPQPPPELLLLPRSEVPEDLREGDELEVFVYLDSEDRPVATLRAPKLQLGEVAFLEVTDTTRFGAFVDWGLPKDLLLPFKEQTRDVEQGDWEPVGLIMDRTGRLAGTMRIRELLNPSGRFKLDEWVEGEAWREEPGIGVFVILERQYVGLLPEREPHSLRRGQEASFRVTHVQPDGKIELSLRGLGHEELDNDAQFLLKKLALAATPKVSDASSPEQIRALFGLSKKAFKRAVGRLLKQGAVSLDPQGFVVLNAKR